MRERHSCELPIYVRNVSLGQCSFNCRCTSRPPRPAFDRGGIIKTAWMLRGRAALLVRRHPDAEAPAMFILSLPVSSWACALASLALNDPSNRLRLRLLPEAY